MHIRTVSGDPPHAARLSARVPLGIVEALEQTGLGRAELCASAGIEVSELVSPSVRFSRAEIYRLCDHALSLTADPALGLHCAERLSISTFNPLSHLIAHSANLRECLRSFCEFLGLLCEDSTFQLSELPETVTLRLLCPLAEDPCVRRFWSEFCIGGVLRMLRSAGQYARPIRWNFSHPEPSYCEEYRRLFAGEVRFDQLFSEVVFDSRAMDAVSPHRDADVHVALRAIAERRMRDGAHHAPFAERVRNRLVQRGAELGDNMNEVARSLGLSARSLRRRLAEEGQSYQKVVSEAKAIVANRYLRERGLSIQEAAYEMGFMDASTFHRAFKRWTGLTPGEARAAIRKEAS